MTIIDDNYYPSTSRIITVCIKLF